MKAITFAAVLLRDIIFVERHHSAAQTFDVLLPFVVLAKSMGRFSHLAYSGHPGTGQAF